MTLALHAGAILVFLSVAPPKAASTIHRLEPIRLVFKRSETGTRKSEAPHFFSELPPDRADVAPKHADFLSNVTSRARDRVPGGDADMPRMQGESDAPTVRLDSDGGGSRSQAAPSPLPSRDPRTAPQPPQRPDAPAQAQAGDAGIRPTSPKASEPDTIRLGDDAPHGLPGSGSSDVDQPEMENPGGNASLTGDVSLNTTAWDYAPWLQRFGRQLMRRWIAPPAYTMGLLKDGGWALIEVEISRSGKMLRLDLLEEHGHPTLTVAAEGALRSVAPIEPLPADFPEPTLILRIRMIYPRIRPR